MNLQFYRLRNSIIQASQSTKLAWIVLLFGLALTILASVEIDRYTSKDIEKTFFDQTDEITSIIRDRLIAYEQVLWGGASFINAVGEFDREMWRDYVSNLNINEQWPGIQGIGVSIPLAASKVTDHVAKIRAEGFPDYNIKPEGDREEYSTIIFLEPFDWRNQRAFGYDMWSNEMRRAAMTRARDTGMASTSGIITLVQETDEDVQRGFLTYVPLYQKDMPTDNVEARRAAFLGWVYSPFRMGDLMEGLLGKENANINFEIFDEGEIAPESLLFANFEMSEASGEQHILGRQLDLNLQGRIWTIRYASLNGYTDGINGYISWIIGFGGVLVNLLLFIIIRTISSLRFRAEAIAAARTASLQTEIKNAELAHQETREANLELAFQKESMDEHAIVSIADIKGNITYVNDKFCAISGYTREELIGKNHRLLKSGEHSAQLYRDLWKTIANGKPWSGELKNLKKDGGHYWVWSTIVPFMSEDGKPIKYVSIRTDITGHKAAEREIRKFKTTLDLMNDSVRMFDPETLKFTYGNQIARSFGGYSEEEFLTLTVADVNENFDEAQFREITQDLVSGKKKTITRSILQKDKNGDPLHLEVSLQYIQPTGEPPRFISITKDTTERFKVEKAKSEFISIVSHELRTPLTSIKGALGLIQSGTIGELSNSLQNMVKIANNNTDRLIILINDILDMEKLGSGKMSFSMAPVNMTELLDGAIEVNKNYGLLHGVKFIKKVNSADFLVWGDKIRLAQVLANLLSNAAKFSSSDNSTVEVGLVRVGSDIRLSVKDHGIGIPKKAKATIFDRFSQVDTTDQRDKTGTGLGLNIVKAIVDEHGGNVYFEDNIGAGVTFYVDLPELLGPEQLTRKITSGTPKAAQILICEDEPDIAIIIETFLNDAGFSTTKAYTAAEAKTLLANNHFDGMTLDIGLPDQNGISLLQDLRSLPKTEYLPVVIVSAHMPNEKEKLEGNAINVADWLQKPIDPTVVVTRLRSAMTRHQNNNFRILHIEDDSDTREVISALVGGIAIVSNAKSVWEAKALIQRERYDLIILDVQLPDGNGLQLLPLFNKSPQSSPPVIVFSVQEVSKEIASEVQAVLIKSLATNDEILQVIGSFVDPYCKQSN